MPGNAILENIQPVESLLSASIAFLRRYPPFDEMDNGAMRFLAGHLSLVYYPVGSTILSPGANSPPHLYIVQRGLVQLRPAEGYHVSSGDVITLGPGECFSVYALMEKRAVGSPYVAAADTFCYQLPAGIFTELLHRSPRFLEFSTHYLRSLLQESRRLIRMHSASAATEQQTMNRALRDLVKRPPVSCRPETTLATALQLMHGARVGSIVVINQENKPVGIFTRYDVLDRVTLAGRSLTDPIGAVMSQPPISLPCQASVYDAALLIAARGIRHVPVTDDGALIGVVTERDLFAVQRVSMRGINRVIAQANDPDALEQAGRDIQALARTLFAQGIAAEQLTQLITALNDSLSQRVIAVVQKKHDLDGIRWCWLAFGSEGRQEQTVSTDQDNGLIFTASENADTETARSRLLPFAKEVNDLLDRCGFPRCLGNIMASNPKWCLSAQEWRFQFQDWVKNTDPEALLHSVIFFDFRVLANDEALSADLRDFLIPLVKNHPRFLRQLAQYALEVKPPLGLISDFITEESADGIAFIDLKKSGARLFVDSARVLALAAGVAPANTVQRIRSAGTILKMTEGDINSAVDASLFIQQLRLRSQLTGDTSQHAFANRIFPDKLNEVDRRILKESLRQARRLQSRLALDFQL
jgi:CBS domain-containing protein